MKTMQVLFLVFFLLVCNGHEILEIEELVLPLPGETIFQVISIVRHGVSTGSFELYKSEWVPYKIKDFSPKSHEHLTGLGYGQCWSMGAQTKRQFPKFLTKELLEETMDYEFVVGALQKSIHCSYAYYQGLLLEVPFIAHYTNPVPKEAFDKIGNCHRCHPRAKFPFHKSQLLSDDSGNSIPLMISIQKESFYDLDNFCKPIETKLEKIRMENIPKAAVKFFGLKEDSMDRMMAEKINRHYVHELPNFGMPKSFIKRILNMPGGTLKAKTSYFWDNRDDFSFMAVFTRSIFRHIYYNLLGTKLMVYMAHDNNYQATLNLLLDTEEPGDTISYYASRVIITISEHHETGDQKVRLYKDNQEFDIKGCTSPCLYENFKDVLGTLMNRGGDLKEYCEVE
jgi:hypothetical protein